MKLADILTETHMDAFTSQVEDLLWREYQEDPLLPAAGEYPTDMDDEDYLEFEEHVRDVVKFAQQRRIHNARKAIAMYTDEISKQQEYRRTLH
jgi:hypothetical protein